MASLDQSGHPVIYLNPKLTQDLVVYQFIRLHEYGHHRLGHVKPEWVRYFQTNPFSQLWINRAMERAADCYAAKVLGRQSRSSVEYIAQFFEARQGTSQKDLLHPDGFERAAIIRKCVDLP
jgi:Zn-dependent peptidase ImmA (M78 family)